MIKLDKVQPRVQSLIFLKVSEMIQIDLEMVKVSVI